MGRRRGRRQSALGGVADVGVLSSHLQTLLLCLHPLRERFDVILHRHVNEFVLRLCLDHSGTLGADGLNHPLDVDLAVQASAFDLADDHIDDDECPSASDTGAAVDDDWPCIGDGALPAVDVVQEVQNASGVGRDAVIGPSLRGRYLVILLTWLNILG